MCQGNVWGLWPRQAVGNDLLPRLSHPGAKYLQLKLCSRGKPIPSRQNTFGWIRQDAILAEVLKQCTQVLLMLILRGRGDQHIICIWVTEIKVSENLIDEPLKCLDELESDSMISPNLLWRRLSSQQVVVQSRQCAEWDISQGWSQRSEHDSRHRVSSCLAWGRGGGAKPWGHRDAKLCRFGASPWTRISWFRGSPVLATVGTKLHVVQAWCECDGM